MFCRDTARRVRNNNNQDGEPYLQATCKQENGH